MQKDGVGHAEGHGDKLGGIPNRAGKNLRFKKRFLVFLRFFRF